MARLTEQQWKAHYERMNNFMTTKSDRNLPITPEYQFHTEAADDNRSLRYNTGKPDYSLIPLASLKEAAKVLEYGATKYARDNWRKPTNWSVSYACLMRHMAAWQSGEDLDPESGFSHLGHAACNILQMLDMLENHPEELER